MGQGVQDFYYQLQRKQFLRKHQFRIMQISGMNLLEDDLILATSATLPSKKISTSDVKFGGMKFKVPGVVQYEQTWSVEFHAMEDYFVRDEFERWMGKIYDVEKNGYIGNGGSGDYSVYGKEKTIHFVLLNSNLEIVRHYYLIGAFPTAIESTSFDARSEGELITLKYTFAYQYYTDEPGRGAPAGVGGILGKIQKGLQAVGRIGNTVERLGDTTNSVIGMF